MARSSTFGALPPARSIARMVAGGVAVLPVLAALAVLTASALVTTGCARKVGGEALEPGGERPGAGAPDDEREERRDSGGSPSGVDASSRDAGAGPADSGVVALDAGSTAGEPTAEEPAFHGSAIPIPPDVQAEMTGRSWKPELDCPPFGELRLVRVSHWDFEGQVREGELVVAASVAEDVIAAFRAIFEARFPIERMTRVDAYGADDDASMAANNTSAFNCRLTTGGSRLSDHSYGKAIDINPVQNPYVTSGGTVYPPAGAPFVDRSNVRQGMIVRPSPVIDAFAAIGWSWGGDWRGTKDYQHFSESGR